MLGESPNGFRAAGCGTRGLRQLRGRVGPTELGIVGDTGGPWKVGGQVELFTHSGPPPHVGKTGDRPWRGDHAAVVWWSPVTSGHTVMGFVLPLHDRE